MNQQQLDEWKKLADHAPINHDVVICRGSLYLGTACQNCVRCISEADRFFKCVAAVPELIAEVERLREALSFYADEEKWRTLRYYDGGDIARKALGEKND